MAHKSNRDMFSQMIFNYTVSIYNVIATYLAFRIEPL